MKLKRVVSYLFDMANKAMLVFVNGKQHSVTSDNVHFDRIADQLKQGVQTEEDIDDLEMTLGYIAGLKDFRRQFSEKFTVRPGECLWDGMPIHSVLADRIGDCCEKGLPYDNMVRFLENLLQNPYPEAREALSNYILQHEKFTITEDGCFIGYKAVHADGRAFYDGKFKYQIGKVAREPDFDPDQFKSCSRGLHVGTYRYADDFNRKGGRLMYCKCNPAHVITVPSEGSEGKVRLFEVLPIAWMDEDKPLDAEYINTADIPGVTPTIKPTAVVDSKVKPLRDQYGRFISATGTPKAKKTKKANKGTPGPPSTKLINRNSKGHFLPKSQWRYEAS